MEAIRPFNGNISKRIHIVVCKDVKKENSEETEEEYYVLQWKKKHKESLQVLMAGDNSKAMGLKWQDKFDIVEVGEGGKHWHYPPHTKWDPSLNDRVFKILPYSQCRESFLKSRKRRRDAE